MPATSRTITTPKIRLPSLERREGGGDVGPTGSRPSSGGGDESVIGHEIRRNIATFGPGDALGRHLMSAIRHEVIPV